MSERFELARASELQPHLVLPDGKNTKLRRAAFRRVVSNMIVNNPEMLALYPEILNCLQSSDSEVKRMCFLYLETYVKSRPKQLPETLQKLAYEVTNESSSSGTRAVALRTLSSIPAKSFAVRTLELIPDALKSPDPYMRKTACFAVAKAWSISRSDVERSGTLNRLNQLLIKESSPAVVAAAAQALLNITDQSVEMDFVIDFPTTKRMALLIADCPEFSQISMLTAISHFVPQNQSEADELAKIITPGLRHTNAAVAMGTARVLMLLSHYSADLSDTVTQQIFGPLLSQLNRPPEIQYSVLRNIQLLLQTVDPETLGKLRIPPQTFFCKSSDLTYIRSTKIDILTVLCNASNADMVVKELIEFTRVHDDAAAQSRAISALAKLASKHESIAPRTIQVLKQVIQQSMDSESKKTTSTEETAIRELVQLMRRYPEDTSVVDSSLTILLKIKEPPSLEEARCTYIYLLGAYASKGKVEPVFAELANNLTNEKPSVQLAFMTATLKAHFRFPDDSALRDLVQMVLETASNHCTDPDVRDRAFFYSRLFRQSPEAAKAIILTPLTPIAKSEENFDYSQLEDLELSLGYLSSIYLKPADKLFRLAHSRQLKASPALLPRRINKLRELKSTESRGGENGSEYFQNATAVNQGDTMGMPPPTPMPRMVRESSLLDNFQNLQIETAPPDDQNVRLIDI